MDAPRARIGTSGWSYDHWDGILYPSGTPSRDRLRHYTAEFGTVELNASFYRWPRDTTFAGWRQRLPPGFAMSVKAARGLTHAKRLYDPETWIGRMAAGWHELADRRGVLVVQLRPDHERDDDRLGWFLAHLPPWLRVAVELRHPSWQHDDVFELLARHGAAYCVVSGAGIPCVLRVTARFAYVRWHGPDHEHLYAGSYPDADLHWWADRIREWRGTEVFGYAQLRRPRPRRPERPEAARAAPVSCDPPDGCWHRRPTPVPSHPCLAVMDG